MIDPPFRPEPAESLAQRFPAALQGGEQLGLANCFDFQDGLRIMATGCSTPGCTCGKLFAAIFAHEGCAPCGIGEQISDGQITALELRALIVARLEFLAGRKLRLQFRPSKGGLMCAMGEPEGKP